MKKILLLNGPNLSILGLRRTEIYGKITLPEIEFALSTKVKSQGYELQTAQSNSEGELIKILNNIYEESVTKRINLVGIIINPGGYTHTSIALRDALEVFNIEHIPVVEVHLSNIFSREEFRRKSYISEVVNCVITGCGAQGYSFAADYIMNLC